MSGSAPAMLDPTMDNAPNASLKLSLDVGQDREGCSDSLYATPSFALTCYATSPMTRQSLKFCTQNLFPEDSSMIVEWAAANPTSAAAWRSVSGATNVMAEARLPSDL